MVDNFAKIGEKRDKNTART